MGKNKNLPGQMTLEESLAAGEPAHTAPRPSKEPKTTMTVKPSPTSKGVQATTSPAKQKEKPLTEEEIEAKKAAWWAKHNQEVEERQARKKELFGSSSPSENVTDKAEMPSDDTVLPAEDDEEDEELISTSKKKKKQPKICRKYGLKQRKLKEATDFVTKLIASKMAARFDSKYVIAVVELLTMGDI